jgi:asparagine synthase (glutamine-hydrolysing)
MCGIAGILRYGGERVDERRLARMAAVLAHRGPDGEGFHVEHGDPSIGLASRRLAIIDIPGGAQPMSTEDGLFTIVYNGEIFNAGEVRQELEAVGHRFRSRCDTEVVLRGYAQWGPPVLEHLNGMWAFAVWDRAARRLFLARDRLGIKPLVYASTPAGLVFASEIKALLASGLIERSLDFTALPHYLSAFVIPEPYSLYRGVRRLVAGHYLLAEGRACREVPYWDCAFAEEGDRGRAVYRDQVRGLLEDAVQRRLVSDVPLGVFLSGGIDSGLVATIAARSTPGALRSFTLGFEGSSADERPAARRLAVALGARHTEGAVTAREAAATLPAVLAAHDEPSQSLLQAHFISRLARTEVTVALVGVGGDELFSSYPTHRLVDLIARLDRLHAFARSLALSLARVGLGTHGRRLDMLCRMEPDARVTRRLLHQTDAATREALIAPELRSELDLEGPVRHLEQHYARARSPHPLNRLLYVYIKTYLPDELLRTLDTMSMYHSLEARTPLLDYRLVELAMRIPAHHKNSLRTGKVLLREVAKGVLPGNTTRRRKVGFSLPLDVWLRRELTEVLRDVLSEAAVRRRGIFDPDSVSRLLNRYLDGETRLVQPVMMLFAFEQWARQALDVPPKKDEARTPDLHDSPPALSVIVVNWNTAAILRDCLTSVEKHLSTVTHETLVVDNASSDGSPDMVAREFPGVRLIRNSENVGFARANNQAMRQARGTHFLLLNSDTLLLDDSVARLLEQVKRDPAVGIAHCRLVMSDGRLQHSTYRFPRLDLALLEEFVLYKFLSRAAQGRLLLAGYWEQDEERDVDWVSGAFMLLPRQVFEETTGFSEAYFMYGEDLEWCYRIRDAGWRIRYYPQASIVHLDHRSSSARWGDRRIAICIERQLAIYRKREGRLMGSLFHGVKMVGAAIRTIYFALQSVLSRRGDDYYVDMMRYYLLSLRVHAGLVLRQR